MCAAAEESSCQRFRARSDAQKSSAGNVWKVSKVGQDIWFAAGTSAGESNDGNNRITRRERRNSLLIGNDRRILRVAEKRGARR